MQLLLVGTVDAGLFTEGRSALLRLPVEAENAATNQAEHQYKDGEHAQTGPAPEPTHEVRPFVGGRDAVASAGDAE